MDANGRPVAEPVAAPGRAITALVRDGRRIAVVSHTAALPDLEREIGAAVRLALENERLQAEVLAQLDDLRASRVRIVETGDAERRRLERDLHDGAQQRLLALSYDIRLARASAQADRDTRPGRSSPKRPSQAQATLAELREVAQGIYPAILAEAGLMPALATLADVAPLPVELHDVAEGRYPAAVETAAYLLVAEALQDAADRGASHATISAVQDGGRLVVTVEDDGTDAHLRDGPAGRPGRRARWQAGGRPDAAPGGAPVRVVVADDVLLTREGIARLLRDAGIEVVAEAEDAEGLLREVRLTRPDVALVDIRMPPTHTDEGLVAAQAIRTEHPQVGVLVLSQYVEPSYAMRLIQEHPERVGYLLKERVFDIATVVDALRRIVDGETVIDPTIVSRLVGRRRRQDPLADLSEREREVLGLIAEGMSNRAIAARLFVTERTVEAHVTQIFQKLHLPESPDQHRRVLAVLAFLRA